MSAETMTLVDIMQDRARSIIYRIDNRIPPMKYLHLKKDFFSALQRRALIHTTTSFPFSRASLLTFHNWCLTYVHPHPTLSDLVLALHNAGYSGIAWACLVEECPITTSLYGLSRNNYTTLKDHASQCFHTILDPDYLDNITEKVRLFYRSR